MSSVPDHPWLEADRKRMATSLDQGRLGHAPMICGPLGLGKSGLADWLARRLLCLSPVGQDPCGECPSCRMLDAGSHPDCFRVGIPEDKREIPVDSIRELTESLQLTPGIGVRRLGLIEPAEAMNRNAANALLKTLEEPHPGAWLILVSHQPGRLPATVRSRCQTFTIRPPAPSAALEWLRVRCPDATDETLSEALELSAGAPLAARVLVEDSQLDFGHAVLDGLIAIAGGEAVHRVLNDRWTDSAQETWRWLGIWCGVLMRRSQELDGSIRHAERELPSNLDPVGLARLWEQALSGTASCRGNARQDLLLGRWLLEWQRIC